MGGVSSPAPGWLLLHGVPLSPEIWAGVAEQLANRGTVLCPRLDLAVAGEDLPAALATGLAGRLSGPTHVVGHSFGGEVAIDLALTAPHLVTGLTLVCSRDTPFPPFAEAAAALRAGATIDAERAMSRWFRPEELAAAGPLVEYARRQIQHADRPGYARALDAIAAYDRSALVSSIGVPVTLVAAELDPVSTPAAMADLASRLPLARLHVLPRAAHLSPFLDAPTLATLIRSTPSAGVRGV